MQYKTLHLFLGFTALHWAAKHGSSDAVKLLAGSYRADVNIKSHGGYTPLHLACQFGHQDVFDLLVKAYGADPRIRDNHGKTPRQYMMMAGGGTILHQAGDSSGMLQLSISNDTFKQLKDRRRSRRLRQEEAAGTAGILRFGSLSVKVKKTTEAFNNYFGSDSRKSSWGSMTSMDGASISRKSSVISNASSASRKSSFDSDSSMMPPPKNLGPIKKRKSSRKGSDFKSAPTTPTGSSKVDVLGMFSNPMQQLKSDNEESDSEFGFDSQWAMPSLTK